MAKARIPRVFEGKAVSNDDLLEEMILIESVFSETMSRQEKIKKDLHEARVILFILLGINMAILGLVLGVLVRSLFF